MEDSDETEAVQAGANHPDFEGGGVPDQYHWGTVS
jgi:hypothetical protein